MRRSTAPAIFALVLFACGGTDDGASNGEPNTATNNEPDNVDPNNDDNGDVDPPTTGMEAYSERLPNANTFTCSTCHALTEPTADGFTRPGHPIGDAAGRPTYKNGQLTELREAVNTCVTEWMAGDAFSEDDETWTMLRDFLHEQSPAESDALTFEIIAPPDDVSGGDPDVGREVFDSSCAVCHGEGGGGTNKAPPVAGLALDPDYIARRVRTSGAPNSPTYDGLTGGRMPFWAPDRISDDELIDVIAYVAGSDPVDPGNNINGAQNNTNNTELRECDAQHAKVGQTMQFDTKSHNVSGMAEIIDDCTIEITEFTFDGRGIDVRVYAAESGDYDNGFAISGDLLSSAGYDGATLTVQLPDDRTLDEVDGLSIWCVAVGTSFGDGLFQ